MVDPTDTKPPAIPDPPAPHGASLAHRMAGAPPVDAERVAQLRQAVATGNYPLSPDRLAAALLALRQKDTV